MTRKAPLLHRLSSTEVMKALQVLPVLLSLIYTTVSITIWPTHIMCKDNNLEVNYRSCDPLQDVAFSVDSCTYATGKNFTMRLATVLRHPINELFVDISYIFPTGLIPLYSKQVCERNNPEYQFCGKKKGEYIYYTGPFFLTLDNIPSGEFDVRAQFINEDHHTIICADFYINKQ